MDRHWNNIYQYNMYWGWPFFNMWSDLKDVLQSLFMLLEGEENVITFYSSKQRFSHRPLSSSVSPNFFYCFYSYSLHHFPCNLLTVYLESLLTFWGELAFIWRETDQCLNDSNKKTTLVETFLRKKKELEQVPKNAKS